MRGWGCRSNGGALWIGLVLLAVWPSGRPAVAQSAAAQSRPISDNSFLIEEAYNQEPGVVQHISAWQRSLHSAAWAYTFTQEWPVGTQTHQFSYTIPVQRTESPSRTGLGDAALNYRYQLRGAEQRVAIDPRLSANFFRGRSLRIDDRVCGVRPHLSGCVVRSAPRGVSF